MGIKAINTFLKEKCPEAYIVCPISDFKGRKIAIDAAGIIYKYSSSCGKSLIMQTEDPLQPIDRAELVRRIKTSVISFIKNMKENEIELVWCWDGESLPEKAVVAGLKRSSAKKRIKERINEAKDALLIKHPLTRTRKELDDLRKLLIQNTTVWHDEMMSIKHMIETLGFASVTAQYEGEKIASNLAQDKLVTAVWSTDTDNFPLGTELLITGIAPQINGRGYFSCVYLPYILNMFQREYKWDNMSFGISHLVDFCILMGTDFNINLTKTGAKKAFELIKKYATIENVQIHGQKDISCLNHIRTREIFSREPTGIDMNDEQVNFKPDMFKANLNSCIEEHKISETYYDLQSLVSTTVQNMDELRSILRSVAL